MKARKTVRQRDGLRNEEPVRDDVGETACSFHLASSLVRQAWTTLVSSLLFGDAPLKS
jgi:hypothetical protein